MESQKPCPFCTLLSEDPQSSILFENELGFVVRDGFPITDGHTLIIPKRHVGSFFDITAEERDALFQLVDQAKSQLDKEFQPGSYNIGI
ncbi:MAG: HIT family protein, partial [Pseudomonadota bacterium]|nr:HIT family protein [Pseudomonadota bacterium]